jgi:hypothetical protein
MKLADVVFGTTNIPPIGVQILPARAPRYAGDPSAQAPVRLE